MRWFNIILFAVIMIGGLIAMGIMHEKVHMAIYRGHGIESHFEIRGSSFATIPEGDTSSCNDNCELAHNINEVVAYPLQVFYVLIGSALFILICELELIIKGLYLNHSYQSKKN